MKLKYKFQTVEVGNEIVAVPVGNKTGEYGGVIVLNESGADILKYLAEDTDEPTVVDAMLRAYDTDEETMRRAVQKSIEILRTEGLLVN